VLAFIAMYNAQFKNKKMRCRRGDGMIHVTEYFAKSFKIIP